MSVSFEGGNGPRPVASNVVVAPATGMLGTITARVAVPFKKQAGKDPVWNLRVGTDAVLSNAFTVTR